MIQQVNLFVKDLRPTRDVVDLKQTSMAMVFVIGVLALVAGTRGWELLELSSLKSALQSEIQQLGVSGVGSTNSTEVAQQIEQLQADKAAIQAQSRTLQGAQRLGGFSGEIRMLSESSVGGLWLTDFSIFRDSRGDPTINLAGRIHEPSIIGEYVEGLKAHGGIAGTWNRDR